MDEELEALIAGGDAVDADVEALIAGGEPTEPAPQPTPEPPPRPLTNTDVARHTVQGSTGGWSDEIRGVALGRWEPPALDGGVQDWVGSLAHGYAQTALGPVVGVGRAAYQFLDPNAGTYAEERDRERTALAESAADHPFETTAAQIAGGLGTSVLAAPGGVVGAAGVGGTTAAGYNTDPETLVAETALGTGLGAAAGAVPAALGAAGRYVRPYLRGRLGGTLDVVRALVGDAAPRPAAPPVTPPRPAVPGASSGAREVALPGGPIPRLARMPAPRTVVDDVLVRADEVPEVPHRLTRLGEVDISGALDGPPPPPVTLPIRPEGAARQIQALPRPSPPPAPRARSLPLPNPTGTAPRPAYGGALAAAATGATTTPTIRLLGGLRAAVAVDPTAFPPAVAEAAASGDPLRLAQADYAAQQTDPTYRARSAALREGTPTDAYNRPPSPPR